MLYVLAPLLSISIIFSALPMSIDNADDVHLSEIPPMIPMSPPAHRGSNEPFQTHPSPLIQSQAAAHRRQSSSLDLARYFNREEYIRGQIERMITSEEEIEERIKKAQICVNMWTTLSALTTTAVLTISVIGATDYIDPRLTSVLASCGAGMNGFFMWAALQYKKNERTECEKQKRIREALGVPPRLILPEFSTSFDQFKSPD